MLEMKIEDAIIAIVEKMLPRWSDKNIGLLITLDLRDNDYGYGEDGNTQVREAKDACTTVRFLFHRPHNYTKVLVQYSFNNGFDFDNRPGKNPVDFKKYSDHDSCWQSDGMRIFMEHWRNVGKYFNIHPSDVSSFYLFSLFEPIKYVKFERFEPYFATNGYNEYIDGYTVIVEKEIPMNEISKYMPEDE